MSKICKIAIARIFADLIKADRIIDIGEMECWDNICKKYEIDRQIKIAAGDISFAEAIETICDSGEPDLQEQLLSDCRAMTVSDGFCAHSEALLMIAINTLLDKNYDLTGEVYSIPRTDFNIDIATALYIENADDKGINGIIKNNYRSIFKEFQLAGFHFIYIPKIIEHYKNTDQNIVKKILSFVAPTMTNDEIDTKYESLTKMNTATFCKDLLCNKCGFTALRKTKPGLLIKISNSYVGEAQYANYLKINIDCNILFTVQSFIDEFTSMLSSDIYVVNTSEERDNQFHYHGFYKQLLDIFLIRENIRSRIFIKPSSKNIIFKDINADIPDLNRREKALYTLFLCQGQEGLNFKRPKSSTSLQAYEKRMKKIQRRYEAIYSKFGGENNAPVITIDTIRNPMITKIKKSIKRLQKLYNQDDYSITRSNDGTYAVHIEPELIFVTSLYDSKETPFHESDLYKMITAIN